MATINQKFKNPLESDTALEIISGKEPLKQKKFENIAKDTVYTCLAVMGTGVAVTGLYLLAHYLRHY